MSSTAEGAFVLLDRASGPLRKMRNEAQKTDKAFEKLGKSIDGASTNQQAQNLGKTERAVRNVGRAAQDGSVQTSRYRQEMDRSSRAAGNLTTRLGRLGAAVKGLNSLLAPGKLVAFGAAIGVAIQGVNVLSAGVVALIPRITDLGGAMVAFAPTVAGIGLAAVSAKLAFQDLGKALGGNKEALKSLTPEGRKFLSTLQAQQKVVTQLRTTAQRGLFPGLDTSIQRLQRGVPTANRLIGGASRQLGSLAAQASANLTTPQMLKDLSSIGGQGIQILGRLGAGAINLADALVDVVVAGQPFTNWLTKTVEGWTEWAKATAHANRENGGLARFFDRTRSSMTLFGDILKNLWITFKNIGGASRTLGDDLWTSIDKVTKRWADWTGSLTGRNQMTAWFAQARQPLHELGGLVGDIAKAMVGFDTGSLTQTIHALRGAVQPVADLFQSLGTGLGPDLASGIAEVSRTLSELGQSGAMGPVTLLLRTFTGILAAVNNLITAIPQLGTVLGAVVTGGAVAKLAGIFSGGRIGGAGMLPMLMGRGRAGAAAAGGGAGTTAAIAGGAGLTAAESRYGLAAARGTYSLQRQAFGATRLQAGRTALGGLARGGGAAAAGALGILGPLLAVGGGLGALQGNSGAGAEGLWRNFANGATFGLVPGQNAVNGKAIGADQAALQQMISGLPGGGQPTTYGATRRQITALRATRDRVGADTSSTEAERKQLTSDISQEIAARRRLLPTLRDERDARAGNKAGRYSQSLAQAYQTDSKNPAIGKEGAFHNLVTGAEKGLRNTGNNAGAKVIAEQSLAMAREAAKGNPKLMGEYKKLAQAVEARFGDMGRTVNTVNGKIYSGSSREWARIREAIATPAEQARERAKTAFTQLQQDAIGSLMGMGYTRAQAKGFVSGADASGRASSVSPTTTNQKSANAGKGLINTVTGANPITGGGGMPSPLSGFGGPAGARGMRIPGQGTLDTVPLMMGMAAPGELIVNRHTEAQQNAINAMVGAPPLGKLVNNETRPHSAYALGGRTGPAAATAAQAGGGGGGGLQPGIAQAAQMVLAQFPGLSITSTTGGTHAKGSYHYRGMAVDIGGSPDLMNQAAGWISQNMAGSLAEGIHNPNLSIKNGKAVDPSFWGATTWAGHANHIHLAIAGALAALGGGGPSGGAGGGLGLAGMTQSITLPRTQGGKGAASGLYAAAVNAIASGLENKVNTTLGAAGGGVSSATGGLSGGTAGANQTLGRQMMLAAGFGADQWPALKALWTRESGWDANAVNKSSGAAGIPQALGHGNVFALGDARAQIAWGLNYIKGRYGTPSAAWAHENSAGWYAEGGRIPWFGEGGSFRANRPMVIGVGDKDEDVHVVPRRGGQSQPVGGGGHTISIGAIHINNHRSGDIREQVKAELDQAFKDYAEQLDSTPLYDDRELMT